MRDHMEDPVAGDDAMGQDHYYLLKELYTVAGLVSRNGAPEEYYVYDTYGDATLYEWPIGDVNRDGTVNNVDWTFVSNAASDTGKPYFDIDLDGDIDSADATETTNHNGETAIEVTYSSVDNPYFFTGRITDTLHADDLLISEDADFKRLQDNRNRIYDPKHGRWLQRDPAGYVDGLNLYQYVLSNPLLWADFAGFSSYAIGTEYSPDPAEPTALENDNSFGELKDWTKKPRWNNFVSEQQWIMARAVLGGLWKGYYRSANMLNHYRDKRNGGSAVDVGHVSGRVVVDSVRESNPGMIYPVTVFPIPGRGTHYKAFTKEDPEAWKHILKELDFALAYAEKNLSKIQKAPQRAIAMTDFATGNASTPDWIGAIGKYYTRSKASNIGCPRYARFLGRHCGMFLQMDFETKLSDNYDWNANDAEEVIAGSALTPANMNMMHRLGEARAFRVHGTRTLKVYWLCGSRTNAGTKEDARGLIVLW